MTPVTQQVACNPFTKALALSSQADQFDRRRPYRFPAPGVSAVLDGVSYPEYGVVDVDAGGGYGEPWIEVVPYAQGAPNSPFWMRLTGFRAVGNDPATQVWVAREIGTFYCVSGYEGGPPGFPGQVSASGSVAAPRLLSETEFPARLVRPQSGTPGVYAANPSGRGAARVVAPTGGAEKLKFDFARTDRTNRLAMNALWAWVSSP